ncbi:hypothetical protein MIMGU_mgv11b016593mg [Erythranthe guttata]|uniref:Uncharacterized protein n=1 Tax=Erythranthe guttata TaxID=4155 RepID=A0A022Q3T8_ERYGU|nr:hypothetical protein MIMGU_mgv11b016593mg [Erythranthe guttata]
MRPEDEMAEIREILDLLMVSLLSRTPLSNVIHNKRHVSSPTPRSEPPILVREMAKESTSNSKKMILKVMVQTSSKKLLFAQSDDFIDFLCSLLTIPLDEVQCISGSARITSIENLYRSILDLIYKIEEYESQASACLYFQKPDSSSE